MSDKNKFFDPQDANEDPITGEPGAHPVGTGVGAAGAGAIGATVGGVVGGPIGAVVGAAIGGVVGGIVGKNAAESVNPTVEDEYWRTNYSSRPYVEQGRQYEDYEPAYRTGYQSYSRYADSARPYEEIEPELQREYESTHTNKGLTWEQARPAARDAYVRLYEERLAAHKERVKSGEVAIGKHVETETARVAVPLEKERVVVERVTPAEGRQTVAPGEARFGEGEAARVEVYEETPDIRKEAFVREEVRVRKEVQQEVVNAEEQIRREKLDVNTQGRPIVDERPGNLR